MICVPEEVNWLCRPHNTPADEFPNEQRELPDTKGGEFVQTCTLAAKKTINIELGPAVQPFVFMAFCISDRISVFSNNGFCCVPVSPLVNLLYGVIESDQANGGSLIAL